MSVSITRCRSAYTQRITDSLDPDRRNFFTPHRYPVHMVKNTKKRPANTKPPNKGGTAPVSSPNPENPILIPSVPIGCISMSNCKGSLQRQCIQYRLNRPKSSIPSVHVLTLGERIQNLALEASRRPKSPVPGILSHEGTEQDYLYLRKGLHSGADITGYTSNSRLKSRCTCRCWKRADSVWRTFGDSIQIQWDPNIESKVTGVGYAHYKKCLDQLQKDRHAVLSRQAHTGHVKVKAG